MASWKYITPVYIKQPYVSLNNSSSLDIKHLKWALVSLNNKKKFCSHKNFLILVLLKPNKEDVD